MRTRKELKKQAKKTLKTHYAFYIFICILLAVIGGEFQESLEVLRTAEHIESTGGVVTEAPGSQIKAYDVAISALSGTEKKEEKESKDITEERIKQTKKNSAFGRRRGVLAMAVNAISSGSVFVTIFAGILSLIHSRSVAIFIFVILALLFSIFLWFYIQNMSRVVARRVFLEGRIYKKLSISRLAFFFRHKCWTRIAWTMFVTFVYQGLWMLTIVGGIIKIYSYRMVPYIVAENPKLKAREAITLSRHMMKGHKWESFVIDVSMFGWSILGFVTMGLSNVFFTNAYKVAIFSEYYTDLRKLAKENQLEYAEGLNDKYLFEKADRELILEAYQDLEELMEEPPIQVEERRGISKFFADIFGVVWSDLSQEKAYEENQVRKARTKTYGFILEGDAYPDRLATIHRKERTVKEASLHYLRHYSVWSVVIMFFTFSFIGWLWEVSLHLVSDGIFVNRGVLHGPWLPIYGSGGVLILLVLNKFRENPIFEFITAVILSGTVEYSTSYYLQVAHHGKKWWDYSGYYLNLNGRVCAEGLLVFGLGGMVLVYLLAPALDNVIRKIQIKVLIPICIALLVCFGADQVYSGKHPNEGKGITDYHSRVLYSNQNMI